MVEEGGAGMAKTLALSRRLPFGAAAAPTHVSRPPPPTLSQLFARTPAQAESSGEIARITDDEEVAPAQADFQNRPGLSPVRQSWGSRPQGSASRSPQNAFSSLSGVPFLIPHCSSVKGLQGQVFPVQTGLLLSIVTWTKP